MPFFLIALFLFLPLPLFAGNTIGLGQPSPSELTVPVASSTIELGHESYRGIEAQGRLEPQPLLDKSDPLANGMLHFLLSVAFVEDQTDKMITQGQVAARVFGPDNARAQTIRLKPQEDARWVGSLALNRTGETLIKVGSKLADDKKRIYRFFYHTPVADLSGEKLEVLPAE